MRACVEGGDSAIGLLEREAARPGFNINRTFPQGDRGEAQRTLLHMASERCHGEVVAWLLEHGSDADITDRVSV